MKAFDFSEIAQALEDAPPIQGQYEPYTAFSLVGLLQLALRHPNLKASRPELAEIGQRVIDSLSELLKPLHPDIATMLELGSRPENDLTPAEWQAFEQTGIIPDTAGCTLSQLSIEWKRDYVANAQALTIALNKVAELTNGSAEEQAEGLMGVARAIVMSASDAQINAVIAQIEDPNVVQIVISNPFTA